MSTLPRATWVQIWWPFTVLLLWSMLATNGAAIESAGNGLIGIGNPLDLIALLLVVVGRVVTLCALWPAFFVAVGLTGWRLWVSRSRSEA